MKRFLQSLSSGLLEALAFTITAFGLLVVCLFLLVVVTKMIPVTTIDIANNVYWLPYTFMVPLLVLVVVWPISTVFYFSGHSLTWALKKLFRRN